MQVSIDGGKTYVDSCEVRMIFDAYYNGNNTGTESATVHDIMNRL